MITGALQLHLRAPEQDHFTEAQKQIQMPQVVTLYNHRMGIDHFDQYISTYSINLRSKNGDSHVLGFVLIFVSFLCV